MDEWLKCPECNRKLAKKIGKGKWETALKKSKKISFKVEVVFGIITCPKCHHRQNVPPIATIKTLSPREGSRQIEACNA